ncbi:GNAT family N-acetyltransferase [Streptomyces iranensis]|uniref:GNAT family N-acetyltransferase n=1 Tax=Streptomyces iranensis TaxID=576784 RepID=UPI0039B76B2D
MTLRGARVVPRPTVPSDAPSLVTAVREDLAEPGAEQLTIECEGAVIGFVQWSAEADQGYLPLRIDLIWTSIWTRRGAGWTRRGGRGLGTDSVRTLARHLITDHGRHRIAIDPAADNAAAIRCYGKIGDPGSVRVTYRPRAAATRPPGR